MSACERPLIREEASSYYLVPTDSTLVLRQVIIIPPNLARVSIQGGQVVDKKDIDIYYPYCEIEVNTLKATGQSIEPDTFTIYKVSQEEQYARLDREYASVGFGVGLNISMGYGTIRGYANEYYLYSVRQPDVSRLTCLHWMEPGSAYYPSIKEVRQVLGDIFSLELKQ